MAFSQLHGGARSSAGSTAIAAGRMSDSQRLSLIRNKPPMRSGVAAGVVAAGFPPEATITKARQNCSREILYSMQLV